MPMEYLFLIILLVFMIGMMFFQTRKAKQQQEERKNFWSNLAPGTGNRDNRRPDRQGRRSRRTV